MNSRLITIFILMGSALILGILFFTTRKRVRVSKVLLHLGGAVLAFGSVGVIGMMDMLQPQRIYLALQIVFFLFGLIHTWLLYQIHYWAKKEMIFSETIFTLLVMCLGGGVFLLVFYFVHSNNYPGPLASALLVFFIPFLFHKTLCLFATIPSPIYKTWYYSDHLLIPEIENGKAVKVRFRITRSLEDQSAAKFIIRAPLKMDFGSLFLSFINDYNEKNPVGQIQPNRSENPFCWFFYVKKGWGRKKIIDPDLTVQDNKIQEDIIIDAKRILVRDLKI